jgi:hypothetical protein
LWNWKISPSDQCRKRPVPFRGASNPNSRCESMRNQVFFPIIASALVLGACGGVGGVLPGDAVIPPELGAPIVEVVVLAADDLGAIVSSIDADGRRVGRTDSGVRVIEWASEAIDLTVTAPGFHPLDYQIETYPDGGRIEFRLEPVVLTGRITTENGRPLPGARVELGDATDETDNEGRYALERAVPGTMTLSRPAWETSEYEWDGGVDAIDIPMTPLTIRALRLSANDISDPDRWSRILSLADSTGVNGLVIDLKAEDGTVVYRSELPIAAAIGAVTSYFEASEVLAAGDERSLYMIGRIGAFQDNFFAAAEPDHALLTSSGELWRAANGYAWLDPTDPAAYEYAVNLAEEACLLGFDEIQFDFVRWPGGRSEAIFDGEDDQEQRVASVTAFLARAYSVLHPIGCAVSTTVFGIVLQTSPDDRDGTTDSGVGQLVSPMSRVVDVISPTLYTPDYPPGWNHFENPDEHAVEVVTGALNAGKPQLDGFAYFRPWIQTWAISEADQRHVQSAVTDDGMGWLLWSNSANYSEEALPPR